MLLEVMLKKLEKQWEYMCVCVCVCVCVCQKERVSLDPNSLSILIFLNLAYFQANWCIPGI